VKTERPESHWHSRYNLLQ